MGRQGRDDAKMIDISLPHNGWMPRQHQMRLWSYLHGGGRRAMAVWHRRAGKDDVCMHHTAVAAAQRVGNYWHALPEYEQGRKAIWNAVNAHTGRRRIDEAFPHDFRAGINDQQMLLRFKNGSTWQIVGSDRYDATVGSGVAGIVYSEYALSNPSAWAYHRPILEENNGWVAFITTPRGRNHAFEMSKYAQRTPGWFYEKLTALDTGMLTQEQLDETLEEYKALYGIDAGEAQYKQEYLCDWFSALLGAYYAREMAEVRSEDRVQEVEPVAGRPVNYAWDIGVGDDNSIWAFQVVGTQILIFDHLVNHNVGVEWYRDKLVEIEESRGWIHGIDFVPHDAKVKEWGTGKTRVETMTALGLHPQLVPLATLADGINAVRRTLPLCVFHPRTETSGMSALEQYHREWDDELKAFRDAPVHNWASHPSDSFRYLSQAWRHAPRLPAPAMPREPNTWIIPPPREQRRQGLRL